MSDREPPVIRQLNERLANQIAAGEVVERPASVVKELAENSLDAGATRISVSIEDGGRRLVEVVDDGHGMRPDDLLLALSRHATSKLRSAEDLFRIATLGFRGEALPSIAAVSELRLSSRAGGGDGASVLVEGGRVGPVDTASLNQGTRIEVRNLFWNVPARLKFLKTAQAETGAVHDWMQRLALGHPGVGFRLFSDGRELLDLPPRQTLQDRARALLGADVAGSLLSVSATADATQVQGWVAHPRHARPSAKRQFVFLNGRHLHDRLLVAAIREGHAGRLEPRLHGVCVLHLETDPSLVDVNVHPTKSEVRFRRQGEVFALIRDSIAQALEREPGGFGLLGSAPTAGGIVRRTVIHAPGGSVAPTGPVVQERFLPRTPSVSADATPAQRVAENAPYLAASSAVPSTAPAAASPAAHQATPTITGAPPADARATGPLAAGPLPADLHPDLPGVRQIVQLNDMYLLVETDSGVRIVDQHALHEKALWLALGPEATAFEAHGSQETFLARSYTLSAGEVAAVETHLPGLAAHGIEAEVFGPTTILVRHFPALLRRLDWGLFFAELASAGESADPVAALRERLGHRAACRAAVKAGQRLTRAEMLELVRLLLHVERIEHCPHGRPTVLDLPWGELERRFQR